MKLVRFVGDPTGYVVHSDDEWLIGDFQLRAGRPLSWVRAAKGPEAVMINMAHAYLIEDEPA